MSESKKAETSEYKLKKGKFNYYDEKTKGRKIVEAGDVVLLNENQAKAFGDRFESLEVAKAKEKEDKKATKAADKE